MLLLCGVVIRCCLPMFLGLIMVTGLVEQGCCVAMPLRSCSICQFGTLSCALASRQFFFGCGLCPGSLFGSRDFASLQPLVTFLELLYPTSSGPGALGCFFSSVQGHEPCCTRNPVTPSG